jgi:hypothetical protein
VSTTACTDNCEDTQAWDLNADIMIRAVVLAIFVGGVCAVVMLQLLQRLGGGLIRASFFLTIGVKVLCGAIFLFNGLLAPGIALLIFAAGSAMYYFCCARHRVAFAAAHVQLATMSLKGAPDLIFLNIVLLLAQGLWCLLWGLAALGVEFSINNNGQTSTGANGNGLSGTVAVFVALLSLYWGSATLHNVSAFCSASVLGDWWWRGAAETRPVRGAIHRAFTTSFGTLSFGAFLVAMCNALKTMQKIAEEGSKGEKKSPALAFASCILGCILACFTAIIEWANQWAIVYAALTGLSFKPAGLAAVELFKRRGWGALINQDLVGTALFLASFISASFGGLAGGFVAYTLDKSVQRVSHAAIAAFLSFAVAMIMASILSEIIATGTRAVFVAWATDPAALAATHPEELKILAHAWYEAHPQLLHDSGYMVALQSTVSTNVSPPPGGAGPSNFGPPPPAAGQQQPYQQNTFV